MKLLRSDEEEKILKLVAKPTFAQQVIFNPDLVGIQNHKEKVLLNKPIYVGMSVLDLPSISCMISIIITKEALHPQHPAPVHRYG